MRLVEKLPWAARVEAAPGPDSLGIFSPEIFSRHIIYRKRGMAWASSARLPPPGAHPSPLGPPRGERLAHSVGITAARDGESFGDSRFENLASRSMCFAGGLCGKSAGDARPAVPSRPTRRSCGRRRRPATWTHYAIAFAAPDPALNDECMGLRGSKCQD